MIKVINQSLIQSTSLHSLLTTCNGNLIQHNSTCGLTSIVVTEQDRFMLKAWWSPLWETWSDPFDYLQGKWNDRSARSRSTMWFL